MRLFKGMVFLGTDHSILIREALHKRLDEALNALGGLQQGPIKPPFSSTGEAECVAKLQHERLEAVRDLVAALCGSEYNVGRGLPYPPPEGDIRLEEYLSTKV